MSIVNAKISKKEAFKLTQNVQHVKEFLNKELTLLGVVKEEVVSSEGEIKKLCFLLCGDKKGNFSFFGSAVSFNKIVDKITAVFDEEILGDGLKIKISTQKTRNDNDIYVIDVVE